ncbi:hypothetical protein F2P45_27230 [Massilia sp. CCM 8733]|uniref:Uncharacterized protein n=1 Tax=Massilia mucilaginosa TaxID=2609282 RepID=A0ABX0P077_9BURK|nr:hypothetical protein [Massilia mucilaginosa]NHZ92673.1 hypothetical protein [Massilia mucilaginosa]
MNMSDEQNGHGNMESRVARLEADVAAIKIDVAVIKANGATKGDVAELRFELSAQIAKVQSELSAQIVKLQSEHSAQIKELRTETIAKIDAAVHSIRSEMYKIVNEGRIATVLWVTGPFSSPNSFLQSRDLLKNSSDRDRFGRSANHPMLHR